MFSLSLTYTHILFKHSYMNTHMYMYIHTAQRLKRADTHGPSSTLKNNIICVPEQPIWLVALVNLKQATALLASRVW